MLTNFMLILNFSVILLSLHFHRSASESGALEFLDRRLQSLREERIDAGVCEGETDPNNSEEWDLCIADPITLTPRESHCMCDQLCDHFRDCCVDKTFDDLNSIPEGSQNVALLQLPQTDSCIELFNNGYPIAAVYGINRCDDNWSDINVKNKCELDAQQMNSSGVSYSYLQDIPVLSQTFMYRNMFCAVCNNDFKQLMSWNISVDCEGYQIQDILKDVDNNMNPENYDPLTKKWKVFMKDNQWINCSIGIKQFKQKEFIKENNLRNCKKTIDVCPQSWTNDSVSQKCDSYASYVFEDNKVYKNYHCALCNGANIDYIKCFPNASLTTRDYSQSTLWFPLLLDFNFVGEKGGWIGGQHKCPQLGQLYDPLYDKCIAIKCNDNSSKSGCFSDESSKDSDLKCFPFVILEDNEFVIFDNNSIYIKHNKNILEENNYHLLEDNNKTKLKICRNESDLSYDSLTQSPFDVSFGQILLSEISLYTSIFCLTLHLMIYLFVPKLRNLPGKNLMSLSFCLLLGHISFALASYLRADRKIVCVLVAITTHYSYLAAFFWMSILAFDVCKTFRRTSGRRSKGSNRYKFLKYSLYGWLSPAFIVLISAAFDIGLEGSPFRPLYGYRFCWISQRKALLVFFALPVFLIVCANVVLFSLTALGLVRTEEQTKILNKKSDKVRYFLYIKLAFIMGLTWMFGFVASLTDWKVLWYPFIIFNGLQGTAIFIAFSCKKKVFRLLAEKFGFKIGRGGGTTTSDVIRSATGSTSLQTSTLVPTSPDSNVTKIKFTK